MLLAQSAILLSCVTLPMMFTARSHEAEASTDLLCAPHINTSREEPYRLVYTRRAIRHPSSRLYHASWNIDHQPRVMRSRSDCYHLGIVQAREPTSATTVRNPMSFVAGQSCLILNFNTSHRWLGGRCAHEAVVERSK